MLLLLRNKKIFYKIFEFNRMNKTDFIAEERVAASINKASNILQPNRWKKVNLNFICKSLSELMHELLITPVAIRKKEGYTHFELTADNKSICYHFNGIHQSMDYWIIDKQTLRKTENGAEANELNAIDFFIELQHTIGITSNNLTRFIEEIYKGLYADCFILAKTKLSADELADASYQQLEQQMDGHPWLLMNKGRMGFSHSDYLQYAPEAGKPLKLLWLAVSRSSSNFNCMNNFSYDQLITEELGEESIHEFNEFLCLNELAPADYFLMPVHEWQWNNKLVFMFAGEIASKHIVPVGFSSDSYFAQQSIRTFFNVNHPERCYVKTALSILNTTLYRGLSPDKLKVAPMMAQWVSTIMENDEFLKKTGFVLLNEMATLSYVHPHYKQIQGVPYQYKEMLGVIWRESVMKYVKENEKPISMAGLLYIDTNNKPLLLSLIEKSGIDTAQWINAYLHAYLQPVLHCFYRHQLFFVPHGENVILLLRDHVPVRIILKDFVEEVQLAPEAYGQVRKEIREILFEIPEDHVTLFIFTDIFDGFFRYLSSILSTYLDYQEQLFWKQVAEIITDYQQQFPDLSSIYKRYDLFAPYFQRFCLNRFRLVTAGYQENADAPAVAPFAGVLENPITAYKK